MDDDLTQRLLFAESDFLTALESGVQTLASYNQTWSALPDMLFKASRTGSVGSETLHLAHFVASRIANLANCFLDVRRKEESFTALLQLDWDAMVHQMAAMDLNATPKSPLTANELDPHSPRRSITSITNADSSSFLMPAYQWLLNNLHNPYPTAEIKTQIATTSFCQVSSINSWFANARRRIGWTRLCRQHFSNCKGDMVDAARRALVEEDPQRPLPHSLRHAFIKMRVAAEDLYPSTFSKSAFTVDLDTIVKDMTENHRRSVEGGECHQGTPVNFVQAARDSYPSPDRSTTASPPPGDSLTDMSEEDVVPLVPARSKRCRSSAEPADEQSSPAERPIKRLRASTTHLPSPPSSTDGADFSSNRGSPELPPVWPAQPDGNEVLPSRKRRLSDADAVDAAGRPCCPIVTPCHHPISAPLPCSNAQSEQSIDDWINTNFGALFDIPPPVDATEPKLTAGLELELFKNYGIPERFAPTATAETSVSAAGELSEFDSLLQSISGDTFLPPSSDLLEAPYTASFHSPIPDFSEAEWSTLLNDPDAYQPPAHSPFPQYSAESQSLSEIDLSVLQLPQVVPSVNLEGDLASKQAKLDQLHVMQEAVRRMEQELQSEGIEI